MASLRNRLAAYAAGVALILAAVAAGAVTLAQWQDDNSWLSTDLDFAAFQAAVGADPVESPEVRGGSDPFVALVDDEGFVIQSSRPVGADVEAWVEELPAEADPDATIFDSFDDDGQTTVLTATSCDDPDRCAVAVAGAVERNLAPFVRANIAWILLPPLAVAVLVWFGARLLVGRSLRPVDQMRADLDTITTSDPTRRVPVPATGDELQRLGTSMNQTLERLGRAVAANQRFVADAAHELRSPITGVRAAIEVENGKHHSPLLASSLDELDRAGRLIDDLLVLARHQGTVMTAVDVDLDDIVRTVVATAQTGHPDARVTVEVEPVRIQANPDAMTRIVTNLVDNAIHHGGGQVHVSLHRSDSSDSSDSSESNSVSGPEAIVRIDDNGPGIPADARASIFERFARLDPSRDRTGGGSGLGLAIVDDLVSLQHGSITIGDADHLGGARFEIRLPLRRRS